jgi:hypothetical protein
MRAGADVATLAVTLLFVPGVARPQANFPPGAESSEPAPEEASPPFAQAETPPPPTEAPAPPTQPQAATQSAPAGQWVYTQQYGWLWMPYSDAFTSVPANGYGEPYQYVYSSAAGWTWVVAPWVWGIGPWPYFGVYGPSHFGWYGHGWWRSPGRWHFSPAPFRGGFAFPRVRPVPFRGGPAPHGVRPVPFRAGFVARGALVGHVGGHASSGRGGGGGHAGGRGGGHGGHR